MVTLVPMSDELYKDFLDLAIREYAEDHIKDGKWRPEESIEQSAAEFKRLLPEGLHTEGHYLYSIKHDAEGIVGALWSALDTHVRDKSAFIYDIRIYDEFQGKGFGKQALTELENVLRPLGVETIGLHVFGHNQRAYNLYVKMGYIPTNIRMTKKINS